jgi:hypothetical protein
MSLGWVGVCEILDLTDLYVVMCEGKEICRTEWLGHALQIAVQEAKAI